MDYYDILKRNNGNFSNAGCIISLMDVPADNNLAVKIQNTEFDTCHNCTDSVPSGYSALIFCVNNMTKRQRQYCRENGVWDGGGDDDDMLVCSENHYLIAYFGAIISSVCIIVILVVYSINQLLVHRQLVRRSATSNAQ